MSERYPTYYAGQKLTAALLQAAQPIVARKASDETRTSTTTATADSELQLQLEANAVYIMDGFIKYSGATTGDLNIDWTAPTGTLGEWTALGAGNPTITTNGAPGALAADTGTSEVRGYLIRTDTTDITASRSFGCNGATTVLTLLLNGTIRTSTTAGTYSLDWAQVSSDATATTLYTDSWLRLQRTA